jgi:hypothetical protein
LKKNEGCFDDYPVVSWLKYYDIDLEDIGDDVHKTTDGGYILLMASYGGEVKV